MIMGQVSELKDMMEKLMETVKETKEVAAPAPPPNIIVNVPTQPVPEINIP